MIPHWMRRRNLEEAKAFARQHERKIGTVNESVWGNAVCRRPVPERVRGYGLRLRLWAFNVHDGVRLETPRPAGS